MADCTKHDDVIKELSNIKERMSACEQTVNDGWTIIRKTESRVDTLEKSTERVEEKTNSIFRLVKDLTESIKSIDSKLDEYMTNIRAENRETDRRIGNIETNAAINKNNIKWNWQTILAAGTVIVFLVGILSQTLVGV